MTTKSIKPAELLQGIKKANQLRTLKAVQAEIQKVEKLIDRLVDEVGFDNVPKSICIRLESLDYAEYKMLVAAGKDPRTDSITPVLPNNRKGRKEALEMQTAAMLRADELEESLKMVVTDFNPDEVINSISSKEDFIQAAEQAKAAGFHLEMNKKEVEVTDWYFKQNEDGRESVWLVTENNTKHGFFFDSKTAKISRFAKFVK